MASADLRDELSCSICLNIYTDPVTLRCGHSYCQECIDHVWEQSGHHRCPDCRTEFAERPALQRNIALHNIAKHFRSAHPDEEDTGIFCTYCIQATVPAVKSCVCCEAALCKEHLRVHLKFPEHVLVEPSCSLEIRKCSTHMKILEYYCVQDTSCVCASCCLTGEHVGHKVVPMDIASEKEKEKAGIQGKISKQEEQVLVSDVDRQPEIKKMGHLEELCYVTDQERETAQDNFCNLEDLELDKNGGDVGVSDPEDVLVFTMFRKGFADFINYLSRNLGFLKKQTNPEVSRRVNRGVQDILLDADTAGVYVKILERLRTVSWSGKIHRYPETSERFRCSQVLSVTSFQSGKHKWQLETSRLGNWRLGVSYGSTERGGFQAIIGNNETSWCLLRCKQQYSAIHNEREIQLPHKPSCHWIEIVLDYEAGRLSFYELCDPIRHLCTFTATFTEPLYAAVWLYKASVRIRHYDCMSLTH